MNRLSTITVRNTQFALCLDNEGYKASLEVGKLYKVIPDVEASAHGYIRVVDESGEDYAFTLNRFHIVHIPVFVDKILSSALQIQNFSNQRVEWAAG